VIDHLVPFNTVFFRIFQPNSVNDVAVVQRCRKRHPLVTSDQVCAALRLEEVLVTAALVTPDGALGLWASTELATDCFQVEGTARNGDTKLFFDVEPTGTKQPVEVRSVLELHLDVYRHRAEPIGIGQSGDGVLFQRSGPADCYRNNGDEDEKPAY